MAHHTRKLSTDKFTDIVGIVVKDRPFPAIGDADMLAELNAVAEATGPRNGVTTPPNEPPEYLLDRLERDGVLDADERVLIERCAAAAEDLAETAHLAAVAALFRRFAIRYADMGQGAIAGGLRRIAEEVDPRKPNHV